MTKHRTFTLRRKTAIACTLLLLSIGWALPASAISVEDIALSDGQTVYVPAYSHIYSGNNERPFLLTVTVSIRNIDPKNAIRISKVDYYETQGQLVKAYIDKPVDLKPLESLRYVIPERDKTGGSGANFIVTWSSDGLINPPIIESIMIGTQTQQGISFTSRGVAIVPHD